MDVYAPLVVLEQVLLVPAVEVVCHSVRPLERHAALVHLLDSLLHELDLDPSQLRGDPHLLHLLLRLRIKIECELSRLLVICPTVVVLCKGLYSVWVNLF